jgi:hypothetical protein
MIGCYSIAMESPIQSPICQKQLSPVQSRSLAFAQLGDHFIFCNFYPIIWFFFYQVEILCVGDTMSMDDPFNPNIDYEVEQIIQRKRVKVQFCDSIERLYCVYASFGQKFVYKMATIFRFE